MPTKQIDEKEGSGLKTFFFFFFSGLRDKSGRERHPTVGWSETAGRHCSGLTSKPGSTFAWWSYVSFGHRIGKGSEQSILSLIFVYSYNAIYTFSIGKLKQCFNLKCFVIADRISWSSIYTLQSFSKFVFKPKYWGDET